MIPGFLSENGKLVQVIVPQTQNGGAVDSLYVNLKHWQRCTFLLGIGDRAGATTPNITLTQATKGDGTGAKSLGFDTYNVCTPSQTAASDLPVITATDGTNALLPATDNSQVTIDIRDTMLDIANGFEWVKVSVATPGANNVPIAAWAVLYDGDWSGKPSTLPTVVGTGVA